MSESTLHDVEASLTQELRPPLTPAEAVLEADRCLECGGPYAPAPCTTACPADIDVPGFVSAIAMGDLDKAARTIFAENLLGGTCSRVCPVEMLCEGACVLTRDGGRPIEIGALQRFATDHALGHGDLVVRDVAPANGRTVAVVGAGPSGLTCAGELAALGYKVTVFDAHDEVGGLARYAIAPYRQLSEPLPAEAHALESLGVEYRLHTPITGREGFAELERDFDAIFLGVGMGADAESTIPGDHLPGVWDSLPFIEALKTGHPPRVGRRTVVIGGGNTAVDVAREAVRLGASEVTMLYRRMRADMPAFGYEVDEAEAEGVRFQWLAAPVAFHGVHRLEQVECVLMGLGEPDASGRRRPVPMPGSEFRMPADTAVRAIGQRPRTELPGWIAGVTLDHGTLAIDPETGQTGNPKFFAGGDVVNGGDSVVEAVRQGKRAARAIHDWVRCAS